MLFLSGKKRRESKFLYIDTNFKIQISKFKFQNLQFKILSQNEKIVSNKIMTKIEKKN